MTPSARRARYRLLEERKALRRNGPQSRRIGPSAIGRSGVVVCDGEGKGTR